VDLNSYAELAVRLVNTVGAEGQDGDRLVNLEGLRNLVADRQHLNVGVTRNDLEELRDLRAEFRAFFAACADGDGEDAAARLNTLLIQHPVHPQLSGHDDQPWHVHYTESGSVADRYAAGAVMGLAVRLTDVGIDRFGVCQAAGCQGVFIDTSPTGTRPYCSDRCLNRDSVSPLLARKREDGREEAARPVQPK
jgi:predicted RNA-binding Zn ribbon-like protein